MAVMCVLTSKAYAASIWMYFAFSSRRRIMACIDLVMVVCYYRVKLTWSIPLLSNHNVTVRTSSDFVDVLLQFVVVALLGSGRE